MELPKGTLYADELEKFRTLYDSTSETQARESSIPVAIGHSVIILNLELLVPERLQVVLTTVCIQVPTSFWDARE